MSTRTPPTTLATIERFNEAFNRHDVDAVMALMTDDVVFENTSPPPDGERHEGQAAVRAFWERFFAGSPRAHFEAEEIFAAGDRCAVRWRYSWGDGSHPRRRSLPGAGRQGRREAVVREGVTRSPGALRRTSGFFELFKLFKLFDDIDIRQQSVAGRAPRSRRKLAAGVDADRLGAAAVADGDGVVGDLVLRLAGESGFFAGGPVRSYQKRSAVTR